MGALEVDSSLTTTEAILLSEKLVASKGTLPYQDFVFAPSQRPSKRFIIQRDVYLDTNRMSQIDLPAS